MSSESKSHRILIIDNYDSNTYNLYQRIGEITGTQARVVRNDRVTFSDVVSYGPSHIIISPGPGSPEDPAYFGICKEVIVGLGPEVPILGVCLGHQGIGHAFGGRLTRAPRVMHGKTSPVHHHGKGIFKGISSPLIAMRYHSLVLCPESLPEQLQVVAQTEDQIIMAVAHRKFPVFGVQFHPESIGTLAGADLIRNFLSL